MDQDGDLLTEEAFVGGEEANAFSAALQQHSGGGKMALRDVRWHLGLSKFEGIYFERIRTMWLRFTWLNGFDV